MAGENKDGGGSIPYSGIVGVALVAAIVALQQTRLESARPAADSRIPPSRAMLQEVDARLWQDPFAAVAQFRERQRQEAIQDGQLRRKDVPADGKRARPDEAKAPGEGPGKSPTKTNRYANAGTPPKVREAKAPNGAGEKAADADMARPSEPLPPDDAHPFRWRLVDPITKECEKGSTVRLLLPMLLGGRNEEDAEMRRRTRYAVVSSLINAGYIPDNPEGIGYAHLPEGLRGLRRYLVPANVPFEWFGRGKDSALEWTLVLWLDQQHFYAAPVDRLNALVDRLSAGCIAKGRKRLEATVIGPVDSDMATVVLEGTHAHGRIDRGCPSPIPEPALHAPLTFLSASVTGDLSRDSPYCLQDKDGSTRFLRVVGPDRRLSEVLTAEIRTRHLDKVFPWRTAAFVVIGEHDTGYGRNFAAILRDSLKQAGAGEQATDVKFFSYLRQIDGGRPFGQRSARSPDSAREPDKQEGSAPIRSHGAVHVDYLQRLVGDIERYADEEGERDSASRDDGKTPVVKKKDVVAFAILGSDVYDKLLILRALRPKFPKAQFLTTDLDARLLDREEVRWTRNLVVATNFGLTLSDAVQGGAAPFRDGYQTASYFAGLLAAGACAEKVISASRAREALPWLKAPLLYEIGRDRAVPLRLPPIDPRRARELSISDRSEPVSLADCKFSDAYVRKSDSVYVQPPLSPPSFDFGPKCIVLALFFFAALWMAWTAWHTPKLPMQVAQNPREILWGGIGCVFVVIVTAFLAQSLFEDYRNSKVLPVRLMIGGVMIALLHCAGQYLLRSGMLVRMRLAKAVGVLFLLPTMLLIWAALPAFVVNAEPFSWVDGVSVWPSHLLRLAAAGLACFSLWHIGSVSGANGNALEKRFGLQRTSDGRRSRGMDGMSFVWNRHSHRRIRRTEWTISAAASYFLVCFGIIVALDARPGFPVRGDGAAAGNLVLGFVVFMGIVVLMAMIFVSISFARDILGRALKPRPPRFAPAVVALRRVEFGLQPENHSDGNRRFLEYVMLVELVARRTQALLRLIYYPFAVFALMVVARSSVFDNWDTPFGLAIVLGLPFLAVIGCVIWLRFATVRFHRKAIDGAQIELVRLRGRAGVTDHQTWQLERLFERIRDEQRGSFQNILLQPMIRAVLFPIGGISGLELIEQFALSR